ncbi:hypothetical protein N9B95_03085 [Candidatus Pelagibacter sp.]|nr:hypothetical protein [Candidatus Pelagibacter sp.]
MNDKNFNFEILNKKWNYWPQINDSEKIKPNIIHFAGGDGSDYLSNLLDKNIDIKNYLEKYYYHQ